MKKWKKKVNSPAKIFIRLHIKKYPNGIYSNIKYPYEDNTFLIPSGRLWAV